MATREPIRLSRISGTTFRDSRTTSIALTIGATGAEEKNGRGQAGRDSIGALTFRVVQFQEQVYRKQGVSGQVALVRLVLAAHALPRR